jgi:hypothetical protein
MLMLAGSRPEREQASSKAMMAMLNQRMGEGNVGATMVRPLDAPSGLYAGGVSASYPVGDGQLTGNVNALRLPGQDPRITGYGMGYNTRVGPGNLSAQIMKQKDGPYSGQLEYRLPIGRADGSPEEGEVARLTPQQIEKLAEKNVKLTGINKVLDFVAQRVDPQTKGLPTSARTLLETVQGGRSRITEANFLPEEIDVMRQLAELKGGEKGSINYADYVALAKEMNKQGKVPASMSPGLLSMLDPMGNVQTTLGQFRYQRDPKGNLQISDTYDFNPPNPNATQEARTGDYGAFGVYGLIRDYAGERIPPGMGRDVRINLPPVKRSEGSPEEGERLTPQQIEQLSAREALEREAASKPAFLTPKSGKGRQISTKPGELEAAALQGVSEMPYLLAGAPVDLATMAMRPFGYDVEKPMFGSDDLKQRALAAGIRQKPPKGAAARALYELTQLGASAVNPAAPVRGAVKAAQATGEAAKRLASDFQQYNQQISAPGASYAVPPQGRAMAPAPASNLGFYSAAEQAALNLPRKEGPGNAFLNDLMKAPDVKKEELEFMGLDAFLRGKPKVTRQEVQDFISNNRIDVKEVQLGGNIAEDPVGLAKRKEVFDKYEPEILSLYKQMDAAPGDQGLMAKALEIQFRRDREADSLYRIPEPLPTRFDRPTLVLPGGQNYREILLTMPTRGKDELNAAQVAAGDLRRQTADLMEQWKATSELNPGTPATIALYQKVTESRKLRDQAEAKAQALKDRIRSSTYQSSHFDEPNILAHMRVNDRVDADGKKMLLIEEIQSDWHQAGREVGYKNKAGKYGEKVTDEEYKRGADLQNRQRLGSLSPQEEAELSDIMSRHMESLERNRVPDAPFKDTWHQLALKRALKYAADNGYERVGLTTGKQQSQRYNMSQQVDHIGYEPTKKGFYINVISKDGPNVLNGDYTVKELEGIVGKELTQKMLAKEGKNEFNPEIEPDLAEVRRLEGVDLQLEDKGMKKYYDEIYPAFLEKQGKRFNAASGTTQIKTGRGVPGGESVRFVDITPEMKGAVPYAKGGAVERQSTDNRRYL